MPAFVGLVMKYVMPLVDELDNMRSNNADLPIEEMLAATLIASWSEQNRQHFDSAMRRRLRRLLRDNACSLIYRDFTPDMIERVMFGDHFELPWEHEDDAQRDNEDEEMDKGGDKIVHQKRNRKRRDRVDKTLQQMKESDCADLPSKSRQRRRERQRESLTEPEDRSDRRKRRKTAR